MPWYVLYTKSRNEKKVARLLEEKGIEVYCPLQETIKQWSDRKKKVQEPVFRSYIFVKLMDYNLDSIQILYTPGTVRFLWWLKKPGIVRDEEIQMIKDFLNQYKNIESDTEIKQGESVLIMEGPLKEQTGSVIRLQGNKAILYIKSLGLNIVAHVPLQALKSNK
ncbi:MAG: UpxY family transcription antiterminator [Bacteroidota bacterium]